MTTEELRSIPIAELLTHLGYKPVGRSRGGTQLLFRSPLRDDRNASFSVSTTLNLWQDFGTGCGGNVIDLAMALNGNCSFHQAARWLEEQFGTIDDIRVVTDRDYGMNPVRDGDALRDIRVEPLTHRALFSYLLSRGIPSDIGLRYCREIHYTIHGKPFFALCFENLLGGMEIRNAFFKGCHGPKSPSIVYVSKQHRTASCCVFEGFMDFLSYMVLADGRNDSLIRRERCDCIVLNSTSMVQKSIPFIDVYEHAYCYLDNDAAGRKAFERIRDAVGDRVESLSSLYEGYDDLNDYLTGKRSAGHPDSG